MDQRKRAELLIATGVASEKDMKSLGLEGVISAKGERHVQMRVKADSAEPLSDRRVRFIASDETPDRMGDVIKVDGWDLRNFRKNPVILWGHDGSDFPIGKGAVEIGMKADGSSALFVDVEFATAEQNPKAEIAYQLAKGGFLGAVSVGFMPKRTADISDDERAKLGMGAWGVLFEECELLEVSVVSIPANPNALVAGIKSLRDSGSVEAEALDEFADAVTITEREMGKRLERLQGVADEMMKAAEEEAAARTDTLAELAELDQEIEGDDSEVDVLARLFESLDRTAKSQADTSGAIAAILCNMNDHALASRQLVDAISDLTSKLSDMTSGMLDGLVPDVAIPDADQEVKSGISDEAAALLAEITKSLGSLKRPGGNS